MKEETLSLIEEKPRLLSLCVEQSSEGLALADLDGRIIYVNKAFAALHGFRKKELEGRHLSIFYPPSQLAAMKAASRKLLETGTFSGEIWHLRRNGTVFPGLMHNSLLNDETGQSIGMIVTLTDNTDRKKAEELTLFHRDLAVALSSISQLKETLEQVLESALRFEEVDCGGIYLIDRTTGDFDLLVHSGLSPRFVECVAHYSASSPEARLVMKGEIFHGLFSEIFSLEDERGLNEDLKAIVVVPVKHENQVVAALNLASHTHDTIPPPIRSALALFAALGGNVVARIRAEEDRKKLEDQIRDTQKMESLGVLASGVAHDFNNLLTAILGNAEFCLDEISPLSHLRHSIDSIRKASLRAADLCGQLLAYSGEGRFVLVLLDLNATIEEMLALLCAAISKKITLKQNLSSTLPPVLVDATQIRQVIMNLITNASEALENGEGTITVATGTMELDGARQAEMLLPETLPEGTYIFLEITDTGPGMDREMLSRIFEPFFTTKFTGRGLGLAAALGIVRGHGGAIKVDSRPGAGSTFTIFLPAAEEPCEKKAKKVPRGKKRSGEGTILVVEDEDIVLSVEERILESAGFRVLTARDGYEGVQVFRKHAYDIDVVVLDLTMPAMDGEEAFDELRRIRNDIPIIITSGYDAGKMALKLSNKRFVDFIEKPFQATQLMNKIHEVMTP